MQNENKAEKENKLKTHKRLILMIIVSVVVCITASILIFIVVTNQKKKCAGPCPRKKCTTEDPCIVGRKTYTKGFICTEEGEGAICDSGWIFNCHCNTILKGDPLIPDCLCV